MSNNTNGYKEPGQNIVQFAIEEQKIPFTVVAKPGAAVQEVKGWLSDYQKGRNLSISTGLCGALGVIATVGTIGAVSGLAATSGVIAIGGFVVGYMYSRGVKANKTELELLRMHPELLASLAHAVTQGLPDGVAVTVYSQCFARFSKGQSKIPSAAYKEMLATATNASIANWKMSKLTSDAYTAGEEIDMWEEMDDDGGDDDDTPSGLLLPADAHLPAFLRSATPTPAETVGKPDGVVIVPQIAAPISPRLIRPLTDRLVLNGKGFILCRLFIGASRVGKSQLVSDAGTQARLLFPRAKIFVVSASYKAGEDDRYWRFADHVAAYNFIDFPASDNPPADYLQAYSHFEAILKAFDQAPFSEAEPKILICDELNTLMDGRDSSNTATKFCEGVSTRFKMAGSGGSKHGFITWGISPVGDVKSLNLTRSEMSVFQPVFVGEVGEDWNDLVYSTAKTNYLAPSRPPEGYSNGDRVVGIGGQWEKMPPSSRLSETIADCRVAPPSPPNEGLDLAMDVIAQTTIATTFEVPGKINSDGTKEPINPTDDPIWAVINAQPDGEHKMALVIAYKWAEGRIANGRKVDLESFTERARKERNCQYLIDNRNLIWEELNILIA